ncbi:MAG: hypothetical protein ACP5IC_00120 [Minisyncoccia bacterium]
MKFNQNNDKYIWTKHALQKMQFYALSENRIKRIIKFPKRIEESIVPNCIAVMQPTTTKKYSEIWSIYKIENKKIKIITAWRYPGKSSARNPIPIDIMNEIKELI